MALTKVAPAGIGSTPGDGYRIGSSFLHSTGVEITNINATGILTAASLDISGGIDFDGHTELDNVNIAGVVTATTFKGDGSQLTGFTAGQIPNLNGAKIATGTVAAARIDNLSGAKITSGTVAAARIDNLAASKITSGTVATARLGSGTASSSTFLRGDGSWAATGAGTGEQFVKLKNSSGALNDGGENVYAGYRAGASLASGANENTFYGTDAGRDCATGDYNTFIGHRAGENSVNHKNTAIGAEALYNQTSGQQNTAVGYQAGLRITAALYNTAVGHMTLSGDGNSHDVTYTAQYNTVMGYNAGYGISSGERNVLIGAKAGYDMTTGYWNSGLGHQVLENVGVGTCNTAIGYLAGHTINNGSNNICIGNQVTATASDTSNEVTIGNSDINKLRVPGLGLEFVKDHTYGVSGGRKNWFDNGSFDCREGRRANTSMDYGNHHAYGWVTDRFMSRNSVQWSRSTNVPTGKGFHSSTLTNGAGGQIMQAVELPDYGDMGVFAPSSYWCVSFWSTAACNQGGQAFSYDLGSTKTDISIVTPSSGGAYQTTGETASGTSTGTFSRYYMVFQMPSSIISTATGLYFIWGFSAAGYVTGFQLERVPTSTSKPTPYEHVHPAVTTARCRRYCWQFKNARLVGGYKRNDGQCSWQMQHPVPGTHMPSGSNQSADPYSIILHDAGIFTNFQGTLQNPGVTSASRYEYDFRSGYFVMEAQSGWSSTHSFIPSWESAEFEVQHGFF